MLGDYELIANQSKSNPDQFIANPVNIFLLTKKLTKDYETFNELMFKEWWPTHLKESLESKIQDSQIIMPTNKDYEGTIQAIHRLQSTYLLNTKDIQMGNLSDKYPSTRPLNGRVFFSLKDFLNLNLI